jgi:hypothetical protein
VVVFLAQQVRGIVEKVEDDGRRLLVITDDGESIRFSLSPATGAFVEEGRKVGGARLMFEDS